MFIFFVSGQISEDKAVVGAEVECGCIGVGNGVYVIVFFEAVAEVEVG